AGASLDGPGVRASSRGCDVEQRASRSPRARTSAGAPTRQRFEYAPHLGQGIAGLRAPFPNSPARGGAGDVCMASPWEKQFKAFLKRAGTELRRTGDEVKGEAQRLIEEMRDP